MFYSFEKAFCAFCKLERKVCRKKHVTWTNVVTAFLTSVCLMFLFWGGFEPKVIILLATTTIIAEVFVHLRWRLSLSCPHCQFDPLLYKRNPQLASQQVKAHLDFVKTSGQHLLKTNNPFQNLPKISKSELSAAEAQIEKRLSRHV